MLRSLIYAINWQPLFQYRSSRIITNMIFTHEPCAQVYCHHLFTQCCSNNKLTRLLVLHAIWVIFSFSIPIPLSFHINSTNSLYSLFYSHIHQLEVLIHPPTRRPSAHPMWDYRRPPDRNNNLRSQRSSAQSATKVSSYSNIPRPIRIGLSLVAFVCILILGTTSMTYGLPCASSVSRRPMSMSEYSSRTALPDMPYSHMPPMEALRLLIGLFCLICLCSTLSHSSWSIHAAIRYMSRRSTSGRIIRKSRQLQPMYPHFTRSGIHTTLHPSMTNVRCLRSRPHPLAEPARLEAAQAQIDQPISRPTPSLRTAVNSIPSPLCRFKTCSASSS